MTRAATRRWWALGFVLAGYLTVFAGVTMMNVALPPAQLALDLSDGARPWVVTGYALAFGALMPLAGRLADVIGLRHIFVTGMAGFAVASLAGGLAPSVEFFLGARTLQGGTGALVAATRMGLVSLLFPDGSARTPAFAIVGIVMGVGTAGSFLLADALVAGASWRWCLLINVPIAALIYAGVRRSAPTGAVDAGRRVDWRGAFLITTGLALIVLALDRAGTRLDPTTWTLLGAGAVVLTGFVWTLRRSDAPLLPLGLVSDPTRATAFAAVFAAGLAMFAGMFLVATYLQEVVGYGAIATGLTFVPFGIGATLMSLLLGPWSRRMTPTTILTTGLLMLAAALAAFALADADAGYLAILPVLVLMTIGGTAVMVTGADVVTAHAAADSGIAGALANALQQAGAAVGTALLTAIATAATTSWGSPVNELDAALVGYRAAGVAGAVVVAAAAVMTYAAQRRTSTRASAREATPARWVA